MADLHEAMGAVHEALYWLRHLREVERGLFTAASDQRLRALQMRFKLARLERDSITDALTGVLNRRGLDLALAEAVARQREHDGSAALLLLDLDDFKRINDRHSHAVGDEVLRRVAKRLTETVRPTDACARFGGEEFAVVLPGCDLGRAEKIAEDVRRRLAEPSQWEDLGADVRVTTSIGVAQVGAATTVDGLLAAADRALYEAMKMEHRVTADVDGTVSPSQSRPDSRWTLTRSWRSSPRRSRLSSPRPLGTTNSANVQRCYGIRAGRRPGS